MGSHRQKLKTVFRNGTWAAGAQLLEKLFRFLSFPLLLAAYGRENFGLIAIVLAIRGYLGLFSIGTPSGVIRYAARWLRTGETELLGRCSKTAMTFYSGIGVVNALVFLGLGLWGVGLFPVDEGQRELLRNMFFITGAYVLVFWPTQVVGQLLEGAEEIHFVQKCNAARSALEFLWVLVVVKVHIRLDFYLAVRLLLTLGLFPVLLSRWRRCAPGQSFGFGWHWTDFRPVMAYGISAFAIGFSHTSFLELRQVLLGTRAPEIGAVTDFAVVAALVSVLFMTGSWVVRPLIPSAAKAIAGGEGDYLEFIIYRGTKYFWCLVCLPLVLLVVNARTVLSIYGGPEFERLAPWLIIMSISAVDAYLSPVGGVIFASGKLRPFVWSNAILSGLGLLIVWLWAGLWGAKSAVLATGVYWLGQLAFHHLYYFPRVMRIDSWRLFRVAFLKPILAATVTGIVLASVLRLLPFPSPWFSLASTAFLGVVVHFASVYWLTFDPSDRQAVQRLLNQCTRPGWWLSLRKTENG